MAFALDVANVGNNTGDGGGVSPDITLTTGAAVAAGARIFLVATVNSAGNSDTVASCSGGGLTWTLLSGGNDANLSEAMGLFYADAPSGLASSTVLTVAVTGNFFGWAMAASSYTSTGWTQSGTTNSATAVSGTAWSSGSMTVPVGGGLVIAGVGARAGAGTTMTSTPTSPSVEDQDRGTGDGIESILERRIEASNGSVTVAGTFSQATDGYRAITSVWVEPAVVVSGHPAPVQIPFVPPIGR